MYEYKYIGKGVQTIYIGKESYVIGSRDNPNVKSVFTCELKLNKEQMAKLGLEMVKKVNKSRSKGLEDE